MEAILKDLKLTTASGVTMEELTVDLEEKFKLAQENKISGITKEKLFKPYIQIGTDVNDVFQTAIKVSLKEKVVDSKSLK